MPGALQGLFPCLVKVSQGSLNFIVTNICMKKKREKKIVPTANLILFENSSYYFNVAR
jgi:hypothetical protein